MTLEDKRRRRLQFMKALYEKTDGRELAMVDMWELGDELGFSREDTGATAEYLVGEFLMEYAALGGAISITHLGVREVEESMQNPDSPTQHFPPINVIQIGYMANSSIQQGSPGSVQVSVNELAPIATFVEEVRAALDGLGLTPGDRQALAAELSSVESQLQSSRPRRDAILGSLSAVRDILVGAAGNVTAHALLESLAAISGQT